ncbi:hypothetical protein [Burkholderia anthina]|uniref:hypothetical protein n=1 Tax=Burkholderia anthina TaxID=179879 RepID=UPI001589BE61|nr:hypothetical protein [Burkholderia anthina]
MSEISTVPGAEQPEEEQPRQSKRALLFRPAALEFRQHQWRGAIFPNLRMIVLAGHSADGQLVQQYASVGRGEALIENMPRHLLTIHGVAHSSYLMFASACGLAALFDMQSCEQNSR